MKVIGTLLVLIYSALGSLPMDEYHEELYLKPLHGYVYAYFQFTTIWETPLTNDTFDHCNLFPRTLGQLIQLHGVQEMHVSLTKGLWRTETWGYPVKSAPPGAELWAWFRPGTSNVDGKWKELTGALSGLLCSSLNFIDGQNTVSPRLSVRPSGPVPKKGEPSVRYATLPREIVCTENLTPWKKLLPCNLKKGLSTLLNSDHIYNTVYHSLGIHFRPICLSSNCARIGVELIQSVSLVYDLTIIRGLNSWSIQRLFGQGLGRSCRLAKTSHIYVDITSNKTNNAFILKPNTFKRIRSIRGGQFTELASFDLEDHKIDSMYNIEVHYVGKKLNPVNVPPVVHASRYITGYGQELGGITTKIYNRHWGPIKIILLENIPWFIPTFLHTLKVTTSSGQEIKPLKTEYLPGKQRVRPYYMEIMLELPPRSVTSVSIDFEYAFLKWQEYPPDANHGFYMGSAVITALLPVAKNYTAPPRDKSLFVHGVNASRADYLTRITTEVLIISLPTPDFSMPYNVICLACTVVALAFGPLHNITTKKFVVVEAAGKKSSLQRLIEKVKSRFVKRAEIENEEGDSASATENTEKD